MTNRSLDLWEVIGDISKSIKLKVATSIISCLALAALAAFITAAGVNLKTSISIAISLIFPCLVGLYYVVPERFMPAKRMRFSFDNSIGLAELKEFANRMILTSEGTSSAADLLFSGGLIRLEDSVNPNVEVLRMIDLLAGQLMRLQAFDTLEKLRQVREAFVEERGYPPGPNLRE